MVNIDGDTVSEIGEQTLDVGEKCQFLVLGGKVRMKKVQFQNLSVTSLYFGILEIFCYLFEY